MRLCLSRWSFLGYKSAELTEEQIKRQQQRTLKRREQAREKREKDKVNGICTANMYILYFRP